MSALLRAELFKLGSRMIAWLLLGTLVFVVLSAGFSVPAAGTTSDALSLDDPALLARMVGVSLGVPQVTIVLLGVLAFTQEFRYGTITSTFLVEPRRSRVFVAKAQALILASIAITAATLAVAVIVTIAVTRARDGNATAGAELWQTVAAAFAVMALYGVIGLAIGAVLRNQVVAVVVVLVWMNLIERVLIDILPAAGRWTPGGAAWGLLQLGPETMGATLFDAPVSALLLGGYTVVAVAITLVALARDIH